MVLVPSAFVLGIIQRSIHATTCARTCWVKMLFFLLISGRFVIGATVLLMPRHTNLQE